MDQRHSADPDRAASETGPDAQQRHAVPPEPSVSDGLPPERSADGHPPDATAPSSDKEPGGEGTAAGGQESAGSQSSASAESDTAASGQADQAGGSGDAGAGQQGAAGGPSAGAEGQSAAAPASGSASGGTPPAGASSSNASESASGGSSSGQSGVGGGAATGGGRLQALEVSIEGLGDVKARSGGERQGDRSPEEASPDASPMGEDLGEDAPAVLGVVESATGPVAEAREDRGWAVAPGEASRTLPDTGGGDAGSSSGRGQPSTASGGSATDAGATAAGGPGGAGQQTMEDEGASVADAATAAAQAATPPGQAATPVATTHAESEHPSSDGGVSAVDDEAAPQPHQTDAPGSPSVVDAAEPPIAPRHADRDPFEEVDPAGTVRDEDFSLDDLDDEAFRSIPQAPEREPRRVPAPPPERLEPWHGAVRGTWELEDMQDAAEDFLPVGADRRLLGIDPDARVCRVLLGWQGEDAVWLSGEVETGFSPDHVEVRPFADRPSEFLNVTGERVAAPAGRSFPCTLPWRRIGDRLKIGGAVYRPVDPSAMLEVIEQAPSGAFEGEVDLAAHEEMATAPTVDFFGVRAEGRYIAYIVDMSRSMAGRNLNRLRSELEQSLRSLPRGTRFIVLPFNDELLELQPRWTLASPRHASGIGRRLSAVGAYGSTQPMEAFEYAFRGVTPRPDEIFFMTDGRVTAGDEILSRLQVLNASSPRTRIHAIGLGAKAEMPWLRALAGEHGGTSTHAN